MGGTFVQWFLFLLVVGLVVAGLAGTTLSSAASSAQIFHLVFIATFASYALALWPLSIWYHRAWSITLKSTVDAVRKLKFPAVYRVLTMPADAYPSTADVEEFARWLDSLDRI